jgi:murein L,D-transpeptidase YcbB/YkuD
MIHKIKIFFIFLSFLLFAGSCKEKHAAKEKVIVDIPELMDEKVSENMKAVLNFAQDHDHKINDSIKLFQFELVRNFYKQNDFKTIWSSNEEWFPLADSLYFFIERSKYYGLYPSDYHFKALRSLRLNLQEDSITKTDATNWTKAELMLTDAFMRTLKDLHEGRLVPDSLSITSDKNYIDSFFISHLNTAQSTKNITGLFEEVQPKNNDYQSLKNKLKNFVDTMDTTTYLFINFPYEDSISFVKKIHKRLVQSGFADSSVVLPDSAQLRKEVKEYQKKLRLVADGKPGPMLAKTMNANDLHRFQQIAITLDRYKLLHPLPENYIWVNIPSYYLKVIDHDSVVLTSKIIVGKPATRTPELTSQITDMVTYPNWTIPESIIRKDILPVLKTDPGYLARKGFNLVDLDGETVDPYSVDWMKFKKGIPWKIIQGSGDDNALGIFKFNFNNPYSVYLHDTNQRYLFSKKNRAISHGCVRVQNWKQLAFYIAQQDSIATEGKKLSYNTDSINTWISNKSRKRIMVKKRVPLFIKYFTCEGKNDEIIFYDDVYNEDKLLALKYFSDKQL